MKMIETERKRRGIMKNQDKENGKRYKSIKRKKK
jgi:hypothetical protein